jgi:hypothetical protein
VPFVTGTLDLIKSEFKCNNKTLSDVQQMTALHMIASSRKVFDSSFSSANARLLPSAKGIRLVTEGHQETRTDDKG